MKTKRMKSILLVSLAMFLVAGVIWGSVSAAGASAAVQTRNAAEQQAQVQVRTEAKTNDVAGSEEETVAPIGEQKRNRFSNGEGPGKDDADAKGMQTRARDGSGGENCDGTCPNCETREERREQNRAHCTGGGNGENCDGTCPNYETRDERRGQGQGQNRARGGK